MSCCGRDLSSASVVLTDPFPPVFLTFATLLSEESASPLAKLMDAAAPQEDDVALVIGCMTGYSVAILSHLVSTVFGIEEEAGYVKSASMNLRSLEITNAEIIKHKL